MRQVWLTVDGLTFQDDREACSHEQAYRDNLLKNKSHLKQVILPYDERRVNEAVKEVDDACKGPSSKSCEGWRRYAYAILDWVKAAESRDKHIEDLKEIRRIIKRIEKESEMEGT